MWYQLYQQWSEAAVERTMHQVAGVPSGSRTAKLFRGMTQLWTLDLSSLPFIAKETCP